MSDAHLDDLFGGDEEPKPRLAKTWVYLGVGLLLTVLGLACTTLPGGILILLAWSNADIEQVRLRSGYLPDSARPVLQRQLYCIYLSLALAWGAFALQGFLLCGTDWYDQMLLYWLYGSSLETVVTP